jgi:hypothetical protein
MLNREESGERRVLDKQVKGMRERAMAAASSSGTTALEQIREYRKTYAELLAAGSRLKQLQGECDARQLSGLRNWRLSKVYNLTGAEQLLFERRRKDKNILVDRYGQPHEVNQKS